MRQRREGVRGRGKEGGSEGGEKYPFSAIHVHVSETATLSNKVLLSCMCTRSAVVDDEIAAHIYVPSVVAIDHYQDQLLFT